MIKVHIDKNYGLTLYLTISTEYWNGIQNTNHQRRKTGSAPLDFEARKKHRRHSDELHDTELSKPPRRTHCPAINTLGMSAHSH